MKKIIAVTAAAGLLALGASGGAVAGALITGADIKNGTIESQDIKNGTVVSRDIANATIKVRDLTPALRELIRQKGEKGEKGDTGATGPQGPQGPAGQNAATPTSVRTNWVANAPSSIVNPTTLSLKGNDTSVEIQDLNLPVQAQQTLSFTYKGSYGQGDGVRVFIEIGGEYINTFDNFPGAGVNNGDGTFTKTITIGKNGRIGAAGVVKYGPSAETIVTNLTIAGQLIKFSA